MVEDEEDELAVLEAEPTLLDTEEEDADEDDTDKDDTDEDDTDEEIDNEVDDADKLKLLELEANINGTLKTTEEISAAKEIETSKYVEMVKLERQAQEATIKEQNQNLEDINETLKSAKQELIIEVANANAAK